MNADIDRKIAVILVADVVGYSKHMERDENATLKAYAECEKILKNCLKKYKGSIFNTAGDSALAEFSSAVNAVECGVAFQNDIKKKNKSDKTEVKLEFRIGVNMGDVVKKEGNLFGDGVNIAARLEALAQPNGISISKSVYDLVVPKTKMTFNDLGVQKVKQNEFHAFDILLDPSQKRTLKTKSSSMTLIIGAVAAVVFLGFMGFFFFDSLSMDNKSNPTLEMSSKPLIMIAPIKASGLSEEKKGFANGVTESMISTFSSYKGIRVLSSSTSFYTRKMEMTDEDIRDNYGVKFIVRGSMQVMGEKARLNLEIIDLKIGEVVGTEKRDFNLNDLFDIQDELSAQILGFVQTDLGIGKYFDTVKKRFKTIEDFSLTLDWIRFWRSYTPNGHKKAQAILDDLRTRYPAEHPSLYVFESWQISQRIFLKLSKNEGEDLERLKYILQRNIELHPDLPDAYNARALITLNNLGGTCDDAIADIAKAEESGSNQETLLIGAAVFSKCGQSKEAINRLKELLKIIPNDPGWFQTGFLVTLLYWEGRHQEIYKLVGDKINSDDMDFRVLAIYSILSHENGDHKEAKKYFIRAKDKGINKTRLTSKNYPELNIKTLKILDKIEKSI